MTSEIYRFGAFSFDACTGELRARLEGAEGASAKPQRLQPQPARLLGMLIARRGELLTREEIRDGLWGGVAVDFDRSLHFCIRQVRAALGDSATAPRYIETLPRRGYRLIPEVEGPGAGPTAAARGNARCRGWCAAGVVVLLLVALTVVLRFNRGTASVGRPLRIGIMPFVSPVETEFPGSAAIAEWILEDLTPRAGVRAAIVGPTTTAAYGDAIRELAIEYELDYLINGRFVLDDDDPRLLSELIRISDGAHIWVNAYKATAAPRAIGLEISAATVDRLRLVEPDP